MHKPSMPARSSAPPRPVVLDDSLTSE
jgi:hypothetical protein